MEIEKNSKSESNKGNLSQNTFILLKNIVGMMKSLSTVVNIKDMNQKEMIKIQIQ